jgi:glycosyltransferase involved in cell wall biosynthesis
MKILYLVSNPTYKLDANSGYVSHIKGVINAFTKKGHQVNIIIGKNNNKKSDIGKLDIGTNSKVKLIKRFIPNFLWQTGRELSLMKWNKKIFGKLNEIVKEFHPDIIYERANYLSISGVKIGQKHNIPVFIESNAILSWEKQIRSGRSLIDFLGKRSEKYIYDNCSSIFTVSEPLKERITKEYNIEEDKIIAVSNGVGPEELNPTISSKKIKEKLAIPEKDIIVGYLGSIFPWHGLDNLIKSAKTCLKEMPDLRFLIVGDGEPREALERKTREYKIDEKVIFTGRISKKEVPDYLQIMDICVYPGSQKQINWYGSPIKLFEYGIMRKPIICYKSKVTENILDDLKDGYLIPSGSVEALSKGILKLASEPNLRKKLGKNFQRKVLNNYTWDKIGENILKVIKDKIGK